MNALNEIKIEKQKMIELEKQTLYEAEFLKLNEQEKNSFLSYKEKFLNVRERTLFKRFKNNFWIVHTMSENLLDTHKCHTDWFKRAYTALNALGEIKVMQKINLNENIYKIVCDELNRRKKELQELAITKKSLQKQLPDVLTTIIEKPQSKMHKQTVAVESGSKNNNQKNPAQKNTFNQVQRTKKPLEIKIIEN